jgi:hypothetical protein
MSCPDLQGSQHILNTLNKAHEVLPGAADGTAADTQSVTHHMRQQRVDVWLDDITVCACYALPAVEQFQSNLYNQ